jgi:hypothetical protein
MFVSLFKQFRFSINSKASIINIIEVDIFGTSFFLTSWDDYIGIFLPPPLMGGEKGNGD